MLLLFCSAFRSICIHKGLGDFFPYKRIGYPFCRCANGAKSSFGYPNPVLDILPFKNFSVSLYYRFCISASTSFSANRIVPSAYPLIRFLIGTQNNSVLLSGVPTRYHLRFFFYTLFPHRKSKIQHIFCNLLFWLLFGYLRSSSSLFCTLKNSFFGKIVVYALQHNPCNLICKLLNLIL